MLKITANDILKLLDNRHPIEKYVTVSECKVGASWTSDRCPRLDMWTMARSWAHPSFIGYEIKVNRSDFIKDNKWPDYLPYCTEFYFVCPPDVISINEIPADAGLIITSKNCNKLFIRKKAPYRDIEIPQSILLYILMCRTQITNDLYNKRPSHVIWQERLEQMKKNKHTGHTLSYLISEKVNKEVREIKKKNDLLYRENERLRYIKEWLDKRNIKLEDVTSWGGIRYQFEELITGLPFNFKHNLLDTKNKIEELLKVIL